MGTLVWRKLRISKPTRQYAGITEHFYTLFSKQSLGQAWKERGGRDFNWQGRGVGVGGGQGNLFPGYKGRPLLQKQLVCKGLITKWHDDTAYSGRLTMPLKHTMGLKQCAYTSSLLCGHTHAHTHALACSVCVHVRAWLFMLVVLSPCILTGFKI